MKKKVLTKQILMALAMSAAVCTTGMAEVSIAGPITDGTHNETYDDVVTINNSDTTKAAIHLENAEDPKKVDITANEINIQSDGGGTGGGIWTHKAGNETILKSDNTEILVRNGKADYNTQVFGINAGEEGKITISGKEENTGLLKVKLENTYGGARGISAAKGGSVDIDGAELIVDVHRLNSEHTGNEHDWNDSAYGIVVNSDTFSTYTGNNADTRIDIDTAGDASVFVTSEKTADEVFGIYGAYEGSINLTSGRNVLVDVEHIDETSTSKSNVVGIKGYQSGKIQVEADSVTIEATSETGQSDTVYGIQQQQPKGDGGKVSVLANNNVNITVKGGANSSSAGITVASKNTVENKDTIDIDAGKAVTIQAFGGTVNGISATSSGISTVEAEKISVEATSLTGNTGKAATAVYVMNGKNTITAINSLTLTATANGNNGKAQGIYAYGNSSTDGVVTLSGAGISVTAANGDGNAYGIYAEGVGASNVSLTANKENNEIISDGIGILAGGTNGGASQHLTNVSLNAVQADNVIQAGTVNTYEGMNNSFDVGGKNAVEAAKGASVTLAAKAQNKLFGAVYASGQSKSSGTATHVTIAGLVDEDGNVAASTANYIGSAATIADAGDLDQDTSFDGKAVISALYAEDGAQISLNGAQNVIRTYADNTNENQLERAVWAYNGADINIDGEALISTDRYSTSPNSADIAIVAGTAVGLTAEKVNTEVVDEDRAHVNLNYGTGSEITGDILAAYAGTVNIQQISDTTRSGDAGIRVTGNILAGNNGVLNLDLGNGGTLTGRADDYGDAGLNTTEETVDEGHAGTEFFNPAFSSTIYKGGEVNLTMGEGSVWNVTGQSWITRINTESAPTAESVFTAENPVEALEHMATIDLTQARTEELNGGHALTVYDMKGDAAFNMKLDAVRDNSDMLYMKHAEGNYIINVVDAVTTADMYAGEFDGLRFATVGADSKATFRAVTVGEGVFNVEYEVGTDSYETSTENNAYNGDTLTEAKPGDTMVDNFFASEGEPGASGTEGAQTMALYAEENPGTASDETDSETEGLEETTNFKLIGRADEQISNGGQTIIAMSKVNYSNAVYMDRLNKRMGEARYIDGDDGLWVRLRHDRIGKDDAFRSMNTMFELGYDWHAKGQQDGEHRQGVAFDYMRGTADYQNVAGDGDVRRAGVWLYDTWLGDKGHYSDYVVKYGRLSNDFDIYSELGEKIDGDYDNDVWSVSAEYGRKKDIGNEWYFEPQVQAQYAYVTSADYTTSQGTKVELDGIDSLIGRAGFRLGRDTSEGNTVYFKADILHEFLGDQSIRAMDATGTLSTTYENEGAWYDVGFGFSHRMGEDSYLFLDVEHSFGNDNEDTYQVNIGLNRAF